MKHVVIAGGSGFVGIRLQKLLLEAGYKVTILSRSGKPSLKNVHVVPWLTGACEPEKALGKVDALVNLAGESINGLRWTKAKKARILDSRMTATEELIRIIKNLPEPPAVLVNASAVGYYGMSETETFTEKSVSDANDFLASVVKQWEEKAVEVEQLGVRMVYARLGIVLGKGGALPLMALPYRFFVGGTVGSGKQWVSWIHVEDVARLIQFAIENEVMTGPLNVVAPDPKTMKDFGQTIGTVLRRPHWLPVPSFAMRLLLGEMSSMLLSGQRVLPEKALASGFIFKYSTLEQALQDVFKR